MEHSGRGNTPELVVAPEQRIPDRPVPPPRMVLDRGMLSNGDTAVALHALSKDPTQGIAEAFEKLGPAKALQVGIVCAVIYDLSVLLCMFQLIRAFMGGFEGLAHGRSPEVHTPSLPSEAYIKGALAAAIPLLSIALSMTFTRLIGRGKGTWSGDIFVAGIALLPFAAPFLALSVLGVGNLEVVLVLFVVAACLLVLTLFHGFKDLCGLPPRFAAFAVPAALLVSGYLSKVFWFALLSP